MTVNKRIRYVKDGKFLKTHSPIVAKTNVYSLILNTEDLSYNIYEGNQLFVTNQLPAALSPHEYKKRIKKIFQDMGVQFCKETRKKKVILDGQQ